MTMMFVWGKLKWERKQKSQHSIPIDVHSRTCCYLCCCHFLTFTISIPTMEKDQSSPHNVWIPSLTPSVVQVQDNIHSAVYMWGKMWGSERKKKVEGIVVSSVLEVNVSCDGGSAGLGCEVEACEWWYWWREWRANKERKSNIKVGQPYLERKRL